MKYTVYKIVNKINGRIYIGCHKTINLNDDYMGSGLLIKRAIEKYGIENFEKEILEVFDNPEAMFEMEARLIDPSDPKTYNLKEGGFGGWSYINQNDLNISGFKDRESFEDARRKSLSETMKVVMKKEFEDGSERATNFLKNRASFKGKTHTEDAKKRIGFANKKLVGERNGSFGTIWVTNGVDSKKIDKNDPVPDGWKRGRKM